MSSGFFAIFFAPVRLGHRAEHLLGRLARRKVGDEFRIEIFHVLIQPGEQLVNCGRTPSVASSIQHALQPLQQLHPFLDDGQVRGEVRVKDVVESHPPQGGHHLARHQRAAGISEAFPERRAHGGRRLHHDGLRRVIQRRPHPFNVAVLH